MGEKKLKAVVGLGNPGPAYADTRHNLGFMVLDRLARQVGVSFAKEVKLCSRLAVLRLEDREVYLLKPQTYMNLSGEAVKLLVEKKELFPEEILVIYDDLDLPLGRLKLALSGSSGGHRGMGSVLESLGTTSVPRLRLGIGRPPAGLDPATYVLSPFAPEEREELDRVLERAVAAVECALQEGMAQAMNKFNRRQP
ncbi:peptidyl-tRNA hydrolase [Ammonifex degensii KC4]|uniref:Peptidyl-tRNA hydrolase n=1 Tax=Ammonifex degensii (strain DSM 10501 / KC4) TaxID=429009 RepID=C9RA22_AMMDK|nr:aminoacyl-tRNA hydrolase [Ammonifex degensii]ACX53151.1 peptidyl-tRNA hydrolase [Ammonifex degensii KC4]